MKLALRGKLILGFSLAMIGIGIVAWRGIVGMYGLNAELNSIEEKQFRPAALIADANVALLAWNRAILKHIIVTNRNSMKELEKESGENKTILHEKMEELAGLSGLSDEGRGLIKEIRTSIERADGTEAKVVSLSRSEQQDEARVLMNSDLRPVFNELDANMTTFLQLQRKQLETVMTATDARFNESMRNIIILTIATFVIVVAAAFFIILSITRPIHNSINSLSESAGQVAGGSQQVSIASQKLAESTSQQASALEESSASIEELSAMTQNNSEMSDEGNRLAEECAQIAGRANESMTSLKRAIQVINSSSEKTGKIVKDIDEIAFQTNILSLNAAVEAARAGQAGKGFAVVAEEVRNLALRAAEAAKNTTDLIEGSRKSINEGFTLTQATEKDFGELSESVARLKKLVSEINTASGEQARGIEEINRAVESMNDGTQYNVTASEESAAAAEELSAQARALMDVVDDLSAIVGRIDRRRGDTRQDLKQAQVHEAHKAVQEHANGNGNGAGNGKVVYTNGRATQDSNGKAVHANGNGTHSGNDSHASAEDGAHSGNGREPVAAGKNVRPEDVISLEDDDEHFDRF